jgi:hypothetical protein
VPLNSFLDTPSEPGRSLVVLNRTEPEPIQGMLENLLDGQAVGIEERLDDEYDEDTVLLVEEGEVIGSSRLQELEDAILLVNSDLFITGTRDLEGTQVPTVIEGLTEHPFELRGYPESNTEKLLLILISRHIEKIAYAAGRGTLRTSFQRLSRLVDEKGTREVYETVADTGVDVHVYGQPDWVPPEEFDVTMHGGYNQDFRRSWFVLYEPPPGERGSHDPAALLAIETEPRVWKGFWTYRAPLVGEIATHIRRNL